MNLVQLRKFIGNPDAWAQQLPDGTWYPHRQPLTDEVLREHLDGICTVGTYVGHRRGVGMETVGGVEREQMETVARTLVLDFDKRDGELDVDMHQHALRAKDALIALGVPPMSIGVEFSGNKGYHTWVLLAEYIENRALRRLGRAALALAELPPNTEVFPKQDQVTDLGSLVKLPGGVHQVTRKANNFFGRVPTPAPTAVLLKALGALPEETRARRSGPVDNRFPCLSTIQEGVTEGGRHTQLLHLAAMFRRHGADAGLVEAILRYVNDQGDPVDDLELERTADESGKTGPMCKQLPQDMQDACGDHCINVRLQGLQPRPGQVRGASVGEHVVVTLASREGAKFTLSHDDIELTKGHVRDGR